MVTPTRILFVAVDKQAVGSFISSFGQCEAACVPAGAATGRLRDLIREFRPDWVLCPAYVLLGACGQPEAPARLRLPDQGVHHGPPAGAAEATAAHAAALRVTDKDRLILSLLYRGLRNHEIGRQLGVSTRTVKGYLSRLFAVFDVTNRTELLGAAMDMGVLGVPTSSDQPQP